jgi:ribosomal protein S18 acetylase RimI-like enzyme
MNVRRVRETDLAAFVDLCTEHAVFERADYTPAGKLEALREAFRGDLLLGWVAEATGSLIGYATASIDFSTWRAAKFMHLDCLFIRESARGRGVGCRLFRAVLEEAQRREISELQWQTPEWNLEADKFYRRFGPVVTRKLRYTLQTQTVVASTADSASDDAIPGEVSA